MRRVELRNPSNRNLSSTQLVASCSGMWEIFPLTPTTSLRNGWSCLRTDKVRAFPCSVLHVSELLSCPIFVLCGSSALKRSVRTSAFNPLAWRGSWLLSLLGATMTGLLPERRMMRLCPECATRASLARAKNGIGSLAESVAEAQAMFGVSLNQDVCRRLASSPSKPLRRIQRRPLGSQLGKVSVRSSAIQSRFPLAVQDLVGVSLRRLSSCGPSSSGIGFFFVQQLSTSTQPKSMSHAQSPPGWTGGKFGHAKQFQAKIPLKTRFLKSASANDGISGSTSTSQSNSHTFPSLAKLITLSRRSPGVQHPPFLATPSNRCWTPDTNMNKQQLGVRERPSLHYAPTIIQDVFACVRAIRGTSA